MSDWGTGIGGTAYYAAVTYAASLEMNIVWKPNQREAYPDEYVRKVYTRIIGLAIFTHFSYVLIFAALSYFWPMIYNVGSVVFYVGMMFFARRDCYRIVVTAIHAEVCCFVTVSVLAGGWQLGVGLFLIALATLVYFCPFNHSYIPYLFSIAEIAVFFALKLYADCAAPLYPTLDAGVYNLLYIYNACASFGIILYAGFASKVSATVTKRNLLAENKSLSELANHDQLTGLLSRRSLLERISDFQGEQLVLALGDIDDFKRVNDTYGHICGDYVLETAATLMRKYCGAHAEICRWGGEEFLLLFHGRPCSEAIQSVQALRRAIETYDFVYEGTVLHVTMTFGVCESSGGENPSDLVGCADQRMYSAKKQGKNRVIFAE